MVSLMLGVALIVKAYQPTFLGIAASRPRHGHGFVRVGRSVRQPRGRQHVLRWPLSTM
jgi:hypothetical protein